LPDLSETSPSYRAGAGIYDLFSRCEDAPGLVAAALLPMASGRSVLDLGCGTGKYCAALAPVPRSVVGLDQSPDQLRLARAGCRTAGNVCFAAADACRTPIAPVSVDLAVACWVLGTILDTDRRQAALDGMAAAVRPGGRLVLVENGEGGEFEDLRGRAGGTDGPTRRYNAWVEAAGFRPAAVFDSWFAFESAAQSRAVFTAIWGEQLRGMPAGARVDHRIVLYVMDLPHARGAV